MASYTLAIKPSARKEPESLSDSLIARLVARIEAQAVDPTPPGRRKLQGCKDFWRIRVGDYRVVFIIDDTCKIVSGTRIAHRRDVYGL